MEVQRFTKGVLLTSKLSLFHRAVIQNFNWNYEFLDYRFTRRFYIFVKHPYKICFNKNKREKKPVSYHILFVNILKYFVIKRIHSYLLKVFFNCDFHNLINFRQLSVLEILETVTC